MANNQTPLDNLKNAVRNDNKVVGAGIGAGIGALAGALLPIPVVGPFTGAVIGGILGHRAIKKNSR